MLARMPGWSAQGQFPPQSLPARPPQSLWNAVGQLTDCRYCVLSLLEALPEASFRPSKAAANSGIPKKMLNLTERTK